MSPSIQPLLSYYGDDFTGSTDALEALAVNGVPAVLFLGIPGRSALERFAGCRAVGLAGESRSRSPEWMSEHLPGAFRWLKALGAPVCQYKVCSTFDSSPETGSIGRALEIGQEAFQTPCVPVVVGAPHLGRYVVFTNLFAAGGGSVHRIDRHPTMSLHPVTPMTESDLRAHLSRQTARKIAGFDIVQLRAPDATARFERLLGDAPDAVVFDGLDRASLCASARLIWSLRRAGPVFAVGSAGLTYALIDYWREAGLLAPAAPPPAASAAGRIVAVSGSCSPVTGAQIRWALQNGFAGIALDPGDMEKPYLEEALCRLREGRSVILYSALGTEGVRSGVQRDELAVRAGLLLHALLRQSGVRRAVIAGGDTASHAGRQLGVQALTVAAPLVPGAPICRAHSDDAAFEGIELVLKGGQIGPENFFEMAWRGRA